MRQSDKIKELALALSKAQSEFAPARKSGVNPHLKNKYATLDDIIDAVRGPLAEHGLSFLQMLDTDGAGPALTTMLLHESGQWLAGSTPIDSLDSNRGTNDMQAFGATLTYLKRYALAAMLGVSSDEDTDGNGARTSKRMVQRRSEPAPSGNGKGGGGSRPYDPPTLKAVIQKGIEDKRDNKFAFEGDKEGKYRGALRANLENCFAGDKHSTQKRHFVTEYLTGKASSKDLDAAEVKTLHKWIGATPDEETGEWFPDPTSVVEARHVAKAAEIESGQQELAL